MRVLYNLVSSIMVDYDGNSYEGDLSVRYCKYDSGELTLAIFKEVFYSGREQPGTKYLDELKVGSVESVGLSQNEESLHTAFLGSMGTALHLGHMPLGKAMVLKKFLCAVCYNGGEGVDVDALKEQGLLKIDYEGLSKAISNI